MADLIAGHLPWSQECDNDNTAKGGVLVGIDGSPTSLRAVDFAIGYAARSGTAVIGVYVRPAGAWMVGAPHARLAAEATHDVLAGENVEYFTAQARLLGLRRGFVELRGHPARRIRWLAARLRSDVVVVGFSSRLDHRLLCGSVGVRLAKTARQPIIIVP